MRAAKEDVARGLTVARQRGIDVEVELRRQKRDGLTEEREEERRAGSRGDPPRRLRRRRPLPRSRPRRTRRPPRRPLPRTLRPLRKSLPRRRRLPPRSLLLRKSLPLKRRKLRLRRLRPPRRSPRREEAPARRLRLPRKSPRRRKLRRLRRRLRRLRSRAKEAPAEAPEVVHPKEAAQGCPLRAHRCGQPGAWRRRSALRSVPIAGEEGRSSPQVAREEPRAPQGPAKRRAARAPVQHAVGRARVRQGVVVGDGATRPSPFASTWLASTACTARSSAPRRRCTRTTRAMTRTWATRSA